jgi:hypothetical protein
VSSPQQAKVTNYSEFKKKRKTNVVAVYQDYQYQAGSLSLYVK